MTKPKLKLVFQPPLDSDKKLLSKTENPQRAKKRDTKLKLVFQPPLDSDKKKTETPQRTERHDTKLKVVFQPPLESDKIPLTMTENPPRTRKHENKLELIFQPPLDVDSDKKLSLLDAVLDRRELENQKNLHLYNILLHYNN